MGLGRPPKLVAVNGSHRSNEEKEKRKRIEEKIKVGRDLVAPEWLNDKAKEEFKRIVKESEKLEIIDNMDISFLAMYCDAYANYEDICVKIQEFNLISENGDGVEEVTKARYSLVKMLEKYKNIIMQCSNKLGLATSDRLRLMIPQKEEKEENPYLKYIK